MGLSMGTEEAKRHWLERVKIREVQELENGWTVRTDGWHSSYQVFSTFRGIVVMSDYNPVSFEGGSYTDKHEKLRWISKCNGAEDSYLVSKAKQGTGQSVIGWCSGKAQKQLVKHLQEQLADRCAEDPEYDVGLLIDGAEAGDDIEHLVERFMWPLPGGEETFFISLYQDFLGKHEREDCNESYGRMGAEATSDLWAAWASMRALDDHLVGLGKIGERS